MQIVKLGYQLVQIIHLLHVKIKLVIILILDHIHQYHVIVGYHIVQVMMHKLHVQVLKHVQIII